MRVWGDGGTLRGFWGQSPWERDSHKTDFRPDRWLSLQRTQVLFPEPTLGEPTTVHNSSSRGIWDLWPPREPRHMHIPSTLRHVQTILKILSLKRPVGITLGEHRRYHLMARSRENRWEDEPGSHSIQDLGYVTLNRLRWMCVWAYLFLWDSFEYMTVLKALWKCSLRNQSARWLGLPRQAAVRHLPRAIDCPSLAQGSHYLPHWMLGRMTGRNNLSALNQG